MTALNGYKLMTTFWEDFSIADAFGLTAIKDTYNRSLQSWGRNLEYITELILVLNWKIWQHHENGDESTAQLYNSLWEDSKDYFFEHYTNKDDISYYYSVLD